MIWGPFHQMNEIGALEGGNFKLLKKKKPQNSSPHCPLLGKNSGSLQSLIENTIFSPFPIEILTEKLENSQILLCDSKNYSFEIKNLFALLK